MKKILLTTAMFLFTFAFFSCFSNGNNSQTHQPPQDGQGPPSGEQLIADMDTDGDGKLSEDEVKGPLKNDFDNVDTDGDGYLTEEEIDNAPKPEKPQGGKPDDQ